MISQRFSWYLYWDFTWKMAYDLVSFVTVGRWYQKFISLFIIYVIRISITIPFNLRMKMDRKSENIYSIALHHEIILTMLINYIKWIGSISNKTQTIGNQFSIDRNICNIWEKRSNALIRFMVVLIELKFNSYWIRANEKIK